METCCACADSSTVRGSSESPRLRPDEAQRQQLWRRRGLASLVLLLGLASLGAVGAIQMDVDPYTTRVRCGVWWYSCVCL